MKKAFFFILAAIILTFTGCSAGEKPESEQPVFPAVFSKQAVVLFDGEEYNVLFEQSTEKSVFTLQQPSEAVGLKIEVAGGKAAFFLGGMTVSHESGNLPESFAVCAAKAVNALRAKGVFVLKGERKEMSVYPAQPEASQEGTPAPLYSAIFDENGELDEIKDYTSGLTVCFR